MLMEFVAIFALGAAVGMLINTLIRCLPVEAKLSGKAINNSTAKCQYRKLNAPFMYPVMGLATGIVFVLLYCRFAISVEFILFAYLLSILIAVFFIDLYYKIIPDGLVIAALAGSAAAFAYNLFRPFGVYGDRAWWNPLAGILPGAGFLSLVAITGMLVYKNDGALGMGDIKIFVPIGIFLGWRMCILALLLSLLAGGLTGIFLVASGIKNRKDAIPFGPFIVGATFVTIIWGWDIMKWYL